MNSSKPDAKLESNPDNLIRSNTVELTEAELGGVNGGIKIGSKAESLIHKPEDETHIENLKPRWPHP